MILVINIFLKLLFFLGVLIYSYMTLKCILAFLSNYKTVIQYYGKENFLKESRFSLFIIFTMILLLLLFLYLLINFKL